jgi:ComF family protein
MRHIKNIPNKRMAEIFAEKIFLKLKEEQRNDANIFLKELKNVLIIPIPIGRARLRTRGYNQSSLLARPLAKILNRKIATGILVKTKQTKKQGTTKNKLERVHNIEGSFSVKNSDQIKNRNVILVDDITTTGTTLFEARKILLQAGARNVVAVTVAN